VKTREWGGYCPLVPLATPVLGIGLQMEDSLYNKHAMNGVVVMATGMRQQQQQLL